MKGTPRTWAALLGLAVVGLWVLVELFLHDRWGPAVVLLAAGLLCIALFGLLPIPTSPPQRSQRKAACLPGEDLTGVRVPPLAVRFLDTLEGFEPEDWDRVRMKASGTNRSLFSLWREERKSKQTSRHIESIPDGPVNDETRAALFEVDSRVRSGRLPDNSILVAAVKTATTGLALKPHLQKVEIDQLLRPFLSDPEVRSLLRDAR